MMRLLLVDDHVLFRECLLTLLEGAGFEVVGGASNGREAIELARSLRPDIVLMDLDMPEMDGLTATRRINADESLSEVKVVILTASTASQDLVEAIKAGAEGFLIKDIKPKSLIHLLKGVGRGEPALTPMLAQRLFAEFADPGRTQARANHPKNLTTREMEVLKWMVQGVTSNDALSRQLGLSENTVKFHVRNILDKFDLHNRAQVVGYALREGIVDPESTGI